MIIASCEEVWILGLHHYRGKLLAADAAIRQVFEIMGLFAAKRRSFHPSPSEVEGIELTDREVAHYLRDNKRLFLGADLMFELMQDEPAFSGSTASRALSTCRCDVSRLLSCDSSARSSWIDAE